MDTLAGPFGLPVGYSDHTLGIAIPIAAVARGATVIEKHFTLDRTLPGPDHAASLEPDELKPDGARDTQRRAGARLAAEGARSRRTRQSCRSRARASWPRATDPRARLSPPKRWPVKRPGDGIIADALSGTCSASWRTGTIAADELIEPEPAGHRHRRRRPRAGRRRRPASAPAQIVLGFTDADSGPAMASRCCGVPVLGDDDAVADA